MNLVFIRYFLAVADTGNFTTAAERCHVTQPTLSAGVDDYVNEQDVVDCAKIYARTSLALMAR